jgi:hypothetical protein
LVKPVIKAVASATGQVEVYAKFELNVDLQASYSNPFDPTQVDLHTTFTDPTGHSISVPGFYWQGFNNQLEGTSEVLTADGQPGWKVRFSPTTVGRWSYFVEVVTTGGKAQSANTNFEVSNANNPGYIKVSSHDPTYFEFSNGTPYYAVGQNVGWYGHGGTYDYARWFKQMATNGANYARIWMADWSMGLEWSDGTLGDYTNRLDRAWQLDRVFELAEQNNLYIMLSLLNHGAFNQSVNPEWDKNPYTKKKKD